MVGLIEKTTNRKITDSDKLIATKGADEIDLVNSGLEETMIFAYNQIRDIWKNTKGMQDLRTAAFVSAINKIAESYRALGIFP